MNNEPSSPLGERKFTAPSGFAEAPTEEIRVRPASEVAKDEQPTEGTAETQSSHEKDPIDLAVAFGPSVMSKLNPDIIEKISKSDKLRAMAQKMIDKNLGQELEKHKDLQDRLLKGFGLGTTSGAEVQQTQTRDITDSEPTENDDEYELGEIQNSALTETLGTRYPILGKLIGKRNEHRKKSRDRTFQKLLDRYPDESVDEVKERLKKRERRMSYGKVVGFGAAAVGAYFAVRYGIGHLSGGGGSGHNALTDNQPSGGNGGGHEYTNFRDYFNKPNTALSDQLHHANDMSAGIPGMHELNKDLAIDQIGDMLKGNKNITAMVASQLGIGGGPKMPDLSTLQGSDTSVIDYNHQVNEWANFLGSHPDVRKDVTEQVISALKDGKMGDKITLRPGYLSTGSNNTLGTSIYGTQPGEVFVDPSVGYHDVEAVTWEINGKTVYWETGCGQLAFQSDYVPPVPQAPAYTPPVHNTPSYVPPVHETPPPQAPPPEVAPPPPSVPETPPIPETPTVPELPPPTHTPKGPETGNDFSSPMGPGDFKLPDAVQGPTTVTTPRGTNILEDIFKGPQSESSAQIPNTAPSAPDLGPVTNSAGSDGPQSGEITSP